MDQWVLSNILNFQHDSITRIWLKVKYMYCLLIYTDPKYRVMCYLNLFYDTDPIIDKQYIYLTFDQVLVML